MSLTLPNDPQQQYEEDHFTQAKKANQPTNQHTKSKPLLKVPLYVMIQQAC